MHDIKLENRDLKNSGMRLKITKNSFCKEIYCSKYSFKYGVGILKFKSAK